MNTLRELGTTVPHAIVTRLCDGYAASHPLPADAATHRDYFAAMSATVHRAYKAAVGPMRGVDVHALVMAECIKRQSVLRSAKVTP